MQIVTITTSSQARQTRWYLYFDAPVIALHSINRQVRAEYAQCTIIRRPWVEVFIAGYKGGYEDAEGEQTRAIDLLRRATDITICLHDVLDHRIIFKGNSPSWWTSSRVMRFTVDTVIAHAPKLVALRLAFQYRDDFVVTSVSPTGLFSKRTICFLPLLDKTYSPHLQFNSGDFRFYSVVRVIA